MVRTLQMTKFHVGFKLDFETLAFSFAGVVDPIDQYKAGVTKDIEDAVATVDTSNINYLIACAETIEALPKMGSLNYVKSLYDNLRP
ncbi:Oidioi.mRNA.OKI2018_I69.PAR.g10779.t1.cds [Oikopleura dioica]|uniref:Oidioi.mRNA.OKI2018_I69.PAR.g10779.t1.cds n=1 Tax=Oikopleura dioica TaxID=34765 RepID=A0ABN7RSM3_OIKDI|nr:Oidioi.mRNA.OKI2018_I69.PAR.g10779.t1.cds [Oikopleura dioica]